tara:strand:- start:44 stop:1048 length:1005 start_codon:yes stop_codon:yes gene_type:complete
MPKERFLVIGSNSFSGSHFIKRLIREGYFTHGVSRSDPPHLGFLPYLWNKKNDIKDLFTFTKIDLNKDIEQLIEIIKMDEITHVVNFAAQGMVAQSWVHPEDWYKTNVVSQVEFHNRLRLNKNIEKYVHITTPEVYGDTKGWIKEKDIFDPSTPYAVSRAACDLHLKSFFKAYDFPVVFTRAANVYGPGQQLYRIIPRSFLSALTGKKMDLHGGGTSIRSFIHIDDVTKATLILALKGEPGTTWHLSTTKSISIFDLVKKIFAITNSNFDELVNIGEERLGKDQSYLLDSINIRKKFNWSDKITLEDGLRETNKWVNDNLSIFEQFNWDYQHKK